MLRNNFLLVLLYIVSCLSYILFIFKVIKKINQLSINIIKIFKSTPEKIFSKKDVEDNLEKVPKQTILKELENETIYDILSQLGIDYAQDIFLESQKNFFTKNYSILTILIHQ